MKLFTESLTNPWPKFSIECNTEDPVASSLWKWSRILETIGRVFIGIFVLLGIVLSAGLSDVVNDSDEGILIIICLLGGTLLGVIAYLIFHITALSFGAKARIVQNTSVSAKADLLNLGFSATKSTAATAAPEPSNSASVDSLDLPEL